MALRYSSSSPPFLGDNGAPASDYTSELITIGAGQIYIDFDTGEMWLIADWSDQHNLVWKKFTLT